MMTDNGRFILDGHNVRPCPDLMEWGQAMQTSDRQVARTEVAATGADVSTVFLGLDHRFGGSGAPLLFETMIFGGEHDGYQERYSTWDEAEAGHKKAVALASGKAD